MSLSSEENQAMNTFWRCRECNTGFLGVSPCSEHKGLYEKLGEVQKEDDE